MTFQTDTTPGQMFKRAPVKFVDWTDEKKATALKLWSDGFSASEIAVRLNIESRNAVIGVVHRAGLSRLQGRPRERTRPKLAKAAKPSKPRRSLFTDRVTFPAGSPVSLPLPPIQAEDVARVSFADLEPRHCRWPIGEPQETGFGYCGSDRIPGLPYCSCHAPRAYVPATSKPRAPSSERQPKDDLRLPEVA